MQWCRRAVRATCRKSHWKCMVINRVGRLYLYESSTFSPMQPGRRGRSAGTIWGDRFPVRPDRGRYPRARRPAIPCRAKSPPLGTMPVASTEVVLAERLNSAWPGAARMGDGVSTPLGDRVVAHAFFSSLIPVSSGLCPRDVTRIQPRRVCAVSESMPLLDESLVPKDLGTLDSCDKHRNEGSGWSRAFAPRAAAA